MISTAPAPPSLQSTFNVPSLDNKFDNGGKDIELWSPPTAPNLSTDPIQWSVNDVAVWAKSTLNTTVGFEGSMNETHFHKAYIDGRALFSMVRE